MCSHVYALCLAAVPAACHMLHMPLDTALGIGVCTFGCACKLSKSVPSVGVYSTVVRRGVAHSEVHFLGYP
jgi:hypothetical protein